MRRLRNFGCHLVTSRYTLPEILRYAGTLDSGGVDVVTVGDHTLVPNASASYPNAQMLLGFLGSITRRCKLSPAVTDPVRRHPVEIAQATVTLDQLTRGRAMLGLGAGEMMNLVPFGLEWTRPYTRLKEALDVVRLLWRASPESPANYDGEFFMLKDAYLQMRPFGRPPPLYIGAVGRRTRELSGEKADGWLPVIESPSSLRLHLEDVARGARSGGRNLEDVDAMVTFYSDVNEDRDAALKNVSNVARTQLIQERSVLELSGGTSVPARLSVQRLLANDGSVSSDLKELASSIPDRLVDDVTVVGTAEDCIKGVERYLDAGATSFLMCNLSDDQEGTFREYTHKVIPYLRENYSV